MATDFEKLLARYDFKFPPRLIARESARPRDAARLLVVSGAKEKFTTFQRLPEFLPRGSVLVLNDTKVVPARLEVSRATGGKIKLLYLRRSGKTLVFLSPKKLKGGEKLRFGKNFLGVLGKERGEYRLAPSFAPERIFSLLDKFGETPLPPYIKGVNAKSARVKADYQAVFARARGSVAAPTASLHFTVRLLREIKKRGVKVVFITLHVNLGTFAPLTEAQHAKGELHSEEYSISRNTAAILNKAKKEGRPIIAVGTTVVRALESAVGGNGKISRLAGETRLFIREGYKPKFTDGLITNFHVPRSSLLMLVSAFMPRKRLLNLYKSAIRGNFRLFSFGDGMAILPVVK